MLYQRLITDDGTVVRAEHRPPASGQRSVAIVIVHGFMLHSSHPYMRRVAEWLGGGSRIRRVGAAGDPFWRAMPWPWSSGPDADGWSPDADPPSSGADGASPEADASSPLRASVPPVDDPGLILLDMRGHGRSTGASTLGWYEVLDVAAAVQWARTLGYERVVTLGFSLGAAVVLRHAALMGEVDRVAAVSGPGQWFFRGNSRMRLLHNLVLTAPGRIAVRTLRRTRITNQGWSDPLPIDPVAAAKEMSVPLLVVHGDEDGLFPLSHAERIAAAAPDGEMWLVPGFGHAEAGVDRDLAGRLRGWLVS